MIKIVKQGKHTTVGDKFSITGQSPYMKDHVTKVTVSPKESGICFFVDGEKIKVTGLSMKPSGGVYATFLSNNQGKVVKLTEHLLSALTGMGVTAANIELEGSNQVPVPDRTAQFFCQEIKRVGIVKTKVDLLVAKVIKDIYFTDELGSVAILRPDDGLKVSALVQFLNLFEDQYLKVDITLDNYWSEIMWARPFLRCDCPTNDDYLSAIKSLKSFPKEMEKSPAMVRSNGVWINGMRPLEPVRHKILDIIGDLSVLGYPLKADVCLIRPGHEFHRKLIGFLLTMMRC